MTVARSFAVAVALLALLVRLSLLTRADSEDAHELMTPDSYTYEHLGQALLTQGRLNDPSLDTPTSRAPGYPAFLALIYGAFGPSRRMAVVGQAVLSALTVLLVCLVGQRVLSRAAGVTAALLLTFDPASILAANQMLTETQFTLIVFTAFFAALGIDRAKSPSVGASIAFGLLLGLAALTRPIGLPLIGPGVLWLLWMEGRRAGRSLKAALVSGGIAVGAWSCVVGGGWLVTSPGTQTASMSLGPKKFLLLSRGADIVAQRDGVTPAAARADLLRDAREEAARTGIPIGDLYARKAADLIRSHPGLFLWSQVRWLPELLLGTGAAGLASQLEWSDGIAVRTLRAFCALHLLVVYFGVSMFFVFAMKKREPSDRDGALVFGLIMIASFVVLSAGPQTYSRFRVPMMPLLTLFAGVGLARLEALRVGSGASVLTQQNGSSQRRNLGVRSR